MTGLTVFKNRHLDFMGIMSQKLETAIKVIWTAPVYEAPEIFKDSHAMVGFHAMSSLPGCVVHHEDGTHNSANGSNPQD